MRSSELNMWQSTLDIEDYSAYLERITSCVQSAVSLKSIKVDLCAICTLEACMSPTLNRSSAFRCFKHSGAFEIHDGYNLYTGPPNMQLNHLESPWIM